MLTNVQIEKALGEGLIRISPFHGSRLGLNFYVLTPAKVVISKFDADGLLVENAVPLSQKRYSLAPHEQITVAVEESILLSDRFFGDLICCSTCIESGLHITCGQIEPRYTREIRFGLCNMRDYEYVLRPTSEIVKVRFHRIEDDAPIRFDNTERANYREIIERLRGEKNEALEKAKEIDKQIKELSIIL
jgi:deoxycytidine triphosphate deaminase